MHRIFSMGLVFGFLAWSNVGAAASPVITHLSCGSEGKIVVETFDRSSGVNRQTVHHQGNEILSIQGEISRSTNPYATSGYASYPSYPGGASYPSYPSYPSHPSYPSYPSAVSYPPFVSYASMPPGTSSVSYPSYPVSQQYKVFYANNRLTSAGTSNLVNRRAKEQKLDRTQQQSVADSQLGLAREAVRCCNASEPERTRCMSLYNRTEAGRLDKTGKAAKTVE